MLLSQGLSRSAAGSPSPSSHRDEGALGSGCPLQAVPGPTKRKPRASPCSLAPGLLRLLPASGTRLQGSEGFREVNANSPRKGMALRSHTLSAETLSTLKPRQYSKITCPKKQEHRWALAGPGAGGEQGTEGSSVQGGQRQGGSRPDRARHAAWEGRCAPGPEASRSTRGAGNGAVSARTGWLASFAFFTLYPLVLAELFHEHVLS